MAILEMLIDRLDRAMQAALTALVVGVAATLLVLLNYAVFMRFVVNASVGWAEELPANMLAALTFIGAAYLTRTNEHLGFDSVLRMLAPPLQRLVLAFNLTLMSAFAGLMAYYGTFMALGYQGRMLISVDLPMILFRGALPVGAALIAVICALRVFGVLTGRVRLDDLMPESDA